MSGNGISLINNNYKDKGAHFYKCDFQVHTPRDTNWKGEYSTITSDIDRNKYAESLIAYCRRNNIHAIAITDHNDLCLWKYIKNASINEKKIDGSTYLDTEKIIVFPGIELTLENPPCQAIIIFDAKISENALNHIWGALGITPVPDSELKYGEPQKVNLSFEKIHIRLDKLFINPEEGTIKNRISLAGHYILLPHVSHDGHQSLIRKGFHPYYSSMPCVGGYIEKRYYFNDHDIKPGTRKILEGKDEAWGSKPIGVFQTSDCRTAMAVKTQSGSIVNFIDLGKWPTWVKWTEPTAEALRQACISRCSKIYHEEPSLPSLRVIGVEVSNSKFLKKVTLFLNPQFNAFIGGRGTGKSSQLEYIRWALCDDYVKQDGNEDDMYELPNFEQRRKRLIENTLKDVRGTVTVYYEKYGLTYKIIRSSNNTPDKIIVIQPDGTSIDRTPEQIRSEFPIISYAQKQLSSVGTLPNEIYRLATDPIKDKIQDLNKEINEIVLPKLKKYRSQQLRSSKLKDDINELLISIKTKKEQIKSIKENLKELTEDEHKVVEEHDEVEAEVNILNNINKNIENLSESFYRTLDSINSIPNIEFTEEYTHKKELLVCISQFNNLKESLLKNMDLISKSINGLKNTQEYEMNEKEILDYYEKHKKDYLKCLERSVKNTKQLDDINKLNKEILAADEKLVLLRQELSSINPAIKPKLNPIKEWFELHKKRATLISEQCNTTEKQAKDTLKINVYPNSDRSIIYNNINNILSKGRSIRDKDTKINNILSNIIVSGRPQEAWIQLIDDLEFLVKSKDSEKIEIPPSIKCAQFSDTNISSLRDALTIDFLESIRYVSFDDFIEFKFITGKDKMKNPVYIPFQDASLGQQATSILKVLLAQNSPPLLIDQPEEDLDNEQITAISEEICHTKHNRQLIFVSHNANIVVNGDAELVVTFGYPDPNDTTRGAIINEGSIDYEPIKEQITKVMEGGKEAFELRRKKYGF